MRVIPLVRRGTRGPQPCDPEPLWTPVRYVHHNQECSFCGAPIARAAPGGTTGTRGTKAYYNRLTGEWECIPCRQEAQRAAAAAGEGSH